MLTQIHISNLITIPNLQLDMRNGTTVITGETGAGKSILIDAIELALGNRIAGNVVRPGQEKADITVCFDISKMPSVQAWLQNYDLHTEVQECILRRTITQDGRSRCYINGMPSTLQPLRELGELLINIHSQNAHQSLLKTDKQRDILDRYAGQSEDPAQPILKSDKQRDILDRYAKHYDLVDKVQLFAEEWSTLNKEITELSTISKDRDARGEFLKFQLNELEVLQLQPNEFNSLDLEHKQLAHADELLQHINQALHCLSENEEGNAISTLNHSLQSLETVQRVDPKITQWIDSIKTALIQITDIEDDLRRYLNSVELDPERLQNIEQRIGVLFDLARKHKISPSELYEFQQNLSKEVSELENSGERLSELNKKLKEIEANYFTVANKLSLRRQKAAKKLSCEITNIIHTLALPHSEFEIYLEKEEPSRISASGLDKIVFQIKTNSDQVMQPLHKVVSGGELSRISLAIHIATTNQHATSSLIFDEVDVGIGGGTAEIVGKLLRQLGTTHQILCITHQPQVAAQGHHHLRVEKIVEKNSTYTQVNFLNAEEKVNELARMLGGVEITKKTIAHAKEMLEMCQ
jgi:DNA repair protein RecN (Recombination protein N)